MISDSASIFAKLASIYSNPTTRRFRNHNSNSSSIWIDPVSDVDSPPLLSNGDSIIISADLGLQLENFVAGPVATGRYNSKSEVLREGARLIQDRETRLAALDASIARGLADADAGREMPADELFHRLQAKYRAISAGGE